MAPSASLMECCDIRMEMIGTLVRAGVVRGCDSVHVLRGLLRQLQACFLVVAHRLGSKSVSSKCVADASRVKSAPVR